MDELSGLRQDTNTQINALLDEAESLYDTKASAAGTAFTDGLAEGISSGTSTVTSSVSNVGQEAVNELDTTVTLAMETTGQNIVAGLANGLAAMPEQFQTNLQSVTALLNTWGESIATMGQTISTNFLNGILLYIKKMSTQVNIYLNSALKNVTNWGTSIVEK